MEKKLQEKEVLMDNLENINDLEIGLQNYLQF